MSAQLGELLKKIESLPTLPTVVTRIMELVDNPKTSASEITRVIQLDPSLTVKILKVVNSAYYGFPKQINTITHAIMILGFKDVQSIALSVSVFDIFKTKDGNVDQIFDRTKFWEHSIAVAIASRMLAKRMRYNNPEEAFSAGLLHDIGKIALDQFFHDDLVRVVMMAKKEECLFINAEKRLLEIDHTDIGRLLAQKWGLPDSLVQAIAYHHQPTLMEQLTPLVCFVHVADVLAKKEKIGHSGDDQIPQLVKEVWYFLKLNPADLPKIISELHSEVEKASSFLELTKKTSLDNVEVRK